MKLKNKILLTATVIALTAPASQAFTVGAVGEALFKMLVTKASEVAIAKAIEGLIAKGFSRPVPETYEIGMSPGGFTDVFTGYMGNMVPTQQTRRMWLDPVTGGPLYLTSRAESGMPPVTSSTPFEYTPHTRYFDCVDPSTPRKYAYSRRTSLEYRVWNRVTRENPDHGVPLHPVTVNLGGYRLAENCQTPPGVELGFLTETANVAVPRNGHVDVPVRTQNMLLSSQLPKYEL